MLSNSLGGKEVTTGPATDSTELVVATVNRVVSATYSVGDPGAAGMSDEADTNDSILSSGEGISVVADTDDPPSGDDAEYDDVGSNALDVVVAVTKGFKSYIRLVHSEPVALLIQSILLAKSEPLRL